MIDWRAGIYDWRSRPVLSRRKPGSGAPTAMQCSLKTDGKFKLNGDTITILPWRVLMVQLRVNCTFTLKELVYFSRSSES
jgi:hypothetical protein